MQKINWELKKKKTLGGFTLIEVLVVVFVLSMGVLVIMQGINKTTTYISETAQRTIALNLAKEGLEAMYNIRNTNWRRRSDSRDKCWLKANPMVDEWNDGCANDRWFAWAGRYFLEKNMGIGNYYLDAVWYDSSTFWWNWVARWANGLEWGGMYASNSQKLNEQLDGIVGATKNNPTDTHWRYRIHFIDWDWISHKQFLEEVRKDPTIVQKEESKYWTYWRFIIVGGLYPKDQLWDNSLGLDCRNWEAQWWVCWDSSPKELRLCSTVFYTAPYRGMVHICSIMTNFLK